MSSIGHGTGRAKAQQAGGLDTTSASQGLLPLHLQAGKKHKEDLNASGDEIGMGSYEVLYDSPARGGRGAGRG